MMTGSTNTNPGFEKLCYPKNNLEKQITLITWKLQVRYCKLVYDPGIYEISKKRYAEKVLGGETEGNTEQLGKRNDILKMGHY